MEDRQSQGIKQKESEDLDHSSLSLSSRYSTPLTFPLIFPPGNTNDVWFIESPLTITFKSIFKMFIKGMCV